MLDTHRKTKKREKEVEPSVYADEGHISKCYRCRGTARAFYYQRRSKDNLWIYFECKKHPSNHTSLCKSFRSAIACWNFLQKKGRKEKLEGNRCV